MAAGSVLQMTGKIKCTEIGGLYKTIPLTCLFCMIGGIHICIPLIFRVCFKIHDCQRLSP
jgi:formate hydrogenlyase subunit 3/multisubunit Na+/H+ antiporter MnhD subunit